MSEPVSSPLPFRWLAVSAGTAHHEDEHGPDSLTAWVRELSGTPGGAVQLREKALTDRALWSLARACRGLLPRSTGPLLLINGRPDIARSADADGVHLPASGLPAAAVRRWLDRAGTPALLGVSTHSTDEVMAARRAGADYVTFGPVFATPSKARYGDPVGLAALERAVTAAEGMPVLALGGLTPDRVAPVLAAGAAGVAAIRAFHDPVSRAEMWSALREPTGAEAV